MNEMRKLIETVRLNEYFIKSGWTVGKIFDNTLGNILNTSNSDENEVRYLQSLGFREAAKTVRELQKQTIRIKKELRPYWGMKVVGKEWVDDVEHVGGPYLEASEEYEDEEWYINSIPDSIQSLIDAFYDLLYVAQEQGEEGLANMNSALKEAVVGKRASPSSVVGAEEKWKKKQGWATDDEHNRASRKKKKKEKSVNEAPKKKQTTPGIVYTNLEFFGYEEDEDTGTPDFNGHYSDYEDFPLETMENVGKSIAKFGLTLYIGDLEDGYIWDIRK
jgi:hypothetical protein